MESFDKNIIVQKKHQIISTHSEIINNKLNVTSLQYTCYTELKLNGILYKNGFP